MARRLALAVLIASALVPGARLGADGPAAVNLTLAGSGSSDNSFDATTLSVEGGIGFLVLEFLELGVRQGFGYVETVADKDWNGSTRAAADLFFLTVGPVRPFIGATFGWIYGDAVKDQFIAGPEAGLRVYFSENTFLYGVMEYQVLFDDADNATDNFDDGRFVYAVGFGIGL